MTRHKGLVISIVAVFIFCVNGLPAQASVQWPPQLNAEYPDLTLIDQDGNPTRISDFKGSIIVIEYVGMSCSACQAFSGAHRLGAFGGIAPQSGLKSFEEYFNAFARGVSFSDQRIIFIQMLLYNLSMQAPTSLDAKDWAQHFQMKRTHNRIVLAGTSELMGDSGYHLIPGFQLIDQDFILRSDSTGHQPRHNLYTHLIPLISKYLKNISR